ELNLRTIKGQRYPTISVNTGYNFSDTRSSLGFTTQNTNRGFNYGFAATLNVFDGFRQKRNETIAKIQIENATLAVQQQELAVLAAVDAAFKDYLTNLEMADLARENVAIARRNFEITSDKFRIGTLTPVEVRTAQLNYLNAKVRLSNALYSAKLSELALRELSGTLRLR
ncbi:MAG TPA: TolC family protein, partial [Flavobacterium sp.]|nr:TolC family protein [Flavobacterium sp.]